MSDSAPPPPPPPPSAPVASSKKLFGAQNNIQAELSQQLLRKTSKPATPQTPTAAAASSSPSEDHRPDGTMLPQETSKQIEITDAASVDAAVAAAMAAAEKQRTASVLTGASPSTPASASANAASSKKEKRQFNAVTVLEDLHNHDVKTVLGAVSELSMLENAALVTKDVVEKLSALLVERSDNRLIVTSVLVAISHLAKFSRTKIMLGEAGVISNLVEKLSSFSEGFKRGAIDALLVLCDIKQNRLRLAQHEESLTSARAMIVLLSLLQREEEDMQKRVAKLLELLVEDADSVQFAYASEDIAQAIIVVLENERYDNSDSMFAKETALKLVVRLTSGNVLVAGQPPQPLPTQIADDLMKALCDFGAIDPLVKAIGLTQPRLNLRNLAMDALYNIAHVKDKHRLWIGEHGGVPTIMEFLEFSLNSDNRSDFSQDEKKLIVDMRLKAMRLLCMITEELSEDSKKKELLLNNKQAVINCGGVKTLLLLSGNQEQPQVAELAVKIIGNISVQDNTVKILESGVIDTLLDMLVETAQVHDRTARAKKESVIRAVASFAFYGKSVQKLVEMGVVTRLLKMIQDKVEVMSVLEMFAQMNQHASFQRVLYQNKGIRVIIDLLRGDDDTIKVAALHSLDPFLQTPNGRLALKKDKVIEELKTFVETFEQNIEKEQEEEERKLKEEQEAKKSLSRAAQLAQKYHVKNSEQEKLAEEKRREEMDKKKQAMLSQSIIYQKAKAMLRRIQKEHDPVARLGLDKAEPFQFDYDELLRIDTECVAGCQKRFNEILTTKQANKNQDEHVASRANKATKISATRVEINWRTVEKLEEDEDREQFVTLLGRGAVWDELAEAIEVFTSENEQCIHAFTSQVKCVVVGVSGFVHTLTIPTGEEQEDGTVDTQSELDADAEKNETLHLSDKLTLFYNISKDGYLQNPRVLAGMISMLLLGYDITVFEDAEKIDEEYQIEIDSLKKSCRDTRIGMIGDINILYFHLETAMGLWKPSFAESQAITASAREMLSPDELLIRGWKIIKYNKNGLKQERLLLLTNTSYYTVSFDFANKKIDYAHCKHHPLDEFYLIDIGMVRPRHKKAIGDAKSRESKRMSVLKPLESPGSRLTATEELDLALQQLASSSNDLMADEDDRTHFGFNLVTREAPHKQGPLSKRKKGNLGFVDQEISQADDDYDAMDDPSTIIEVDEPEGEDDEDDEMSSASNDSDDPRTESARKLSASRSAMESDSKQREDERVVKRPNTQGMYHSVFIAPDSVPVSKHKLYIEEIAWCFYAAAVACQRTKLYEPFYADIDKPEGGILADMSKFFYNKLKLGAAKEGKSGKTIKQPKFVDGPAEAQQQQQAASANSPRGSVKQPTAAPANNTSTQEQSTVDAAQQRRAVTRDSSWRKSVNLGTYLASKGATSLDQLKDADEDNKSPKSARVKSTKM